MEENNAIQPRGSWSSLEAYAMAVVCLLLGLPLGYFIAGSTAASQQPAAVVTGQDSLVPAQMQQQAAAMQPQPEAAMPEVAVPEEMKKKAQSIREDIKKNPKDAKSLVELGNIHMYSRMFPQAIKYYSQALEQEPNNQKARLGLGNAYFYAGDADNAITEFQKVLKSDPKNADALFNLGMAQFRGKQDPKAAAETWEKLLASNPNHPKRDQVEKAIAQAKAHQARM